MIDLLMISKLLMAAAAVIGLGFMVKGLIDMQRINAAAPDVLELPAVVRQLTPDGKDMNAMLTLNVEDEVVHVSCHLPGPWFGRSKRQVTDLVRVYWRKGDKRAVAAETIRDGQRMFIIGFVALTAIALLYVILF